LVFGHVTSRSLRGAAADTVDFPWLAGSLILFSTFLEKGGKITAKTELGPLLINDLKSTLDPLKNGVSMNAKEGSDIYHGIVAMNLDVVRIRAPFSHQPTQIQFWFLLSTIETTRRLHCWASFPSELIKARISSTRQAVIRRPRERTGVG